jgi:SAM-dependent methyltransferase
MEILSFEEVGEKRLLSKYSPIYLLAKELKLKYLIRENGIFTGPAVGLACVVDRITSNFQISSVLDLCCGTGALSKISLSNGVKEVTCLDLKIKVAKENLKRFEDKINFIEEDILKFKPKYFYDLIILDAPRELVKELFKEFIPALRNFCNIFLIWHGSVDEEEWNNWVRNKLRKIFKKIFEISCYGEEISCCSSTKKGIELLEKLFKLWS